jgi:hypothetical protein
MTPEELFQLSRQFAIDKLKLGIPPDKAGELESKGWEVWLKTIWPFWFEEEFSEDHRKFWSLFWEVVQDIKAGRTPAPEKMAILLILGRGLGKSASTEAARILRGAILNTGYALIISETDDQAQEHLGNMRMLIEHPESRLTEFYPQMAIAENADLLKGMKTTDRKEMFICKNGFIGRSKGLTAKMRGIRVGTQRPDDVCLDDIDDVDDSIGVSLGKLRIITASILPVVARKNATISFSQNLISENSVINQIYTGKADALAQRTVIGVTNAFANLDIDSSVDPKTGRLRHSILATSVPTWAGLDIYQAQRFLDNSGLQTFLAEYQNQFDQFKSGKVIPEYNEAVQIITWSEFESVYGTRTIPDHWQKRVGLDIGYSEGNHPHYSAWAFVATAAQNSNLPGKTFVYKSRSFKGTSIDDQALQILAETPEHINLWQMSHEKTGEMMTLNRKYKIPFTKFRHYRAEDGVSQWRHLSKVNTEKPHPFREGTMGDCLLFYIVDDDQLQVAKNDRGHKLLREQVPTWEYVPIKITDSGLTQEKPSKINDDVCDALKGVFASFGPASTQLTVEEKFVESIPEQFQPKENPTANEVMARQMYLIKRMRELDEKKVGIAAMPSDIFRDIETKWNTRS